MRTRVLAVVLALGLCLVGVVLGRAVTGADGRSAFVLLATLGVAVVGLLRVRRALRTARDGAAHTPGAADEEGAVGPGPYGAGMSDQTPMPENPTTDPQDAAKPTEEWATGDEPATGPQLSYLDTLAREAGREVPEDLTKARASELIDELQGASPRVDPQ